MLFQHRKPPSIETVYAEYGERIYRFCYRLCGQTAEAEDLTQDVFVAACENLAGFQGRSSLSTWLYRIALYRWRRLHPKGQLPILFLEESMDGLLAEPDPACNCLQRLSLEQAMASLPENLRAAFLMVKVEGLTYREAAEVLDIPIGTIQYHVHEAVKRLRLTLGDGRQPSPGSEQPAKEWINDAV